MLTPSDEPLSFRRAGDADAAAIVALAESAYRGDASRRGWTTEADMLDGQRTDVPGVLAMLAGPDQAILLAERAGRPSGCCHVQRDGDVCWFGLFAVDPDAQGQGIGDALLAQAERHAAQVLGARRMKMKVLWMRDSLIAWYVRRGYRRTDESHPFPYGDPRYGLPRRDDLHFIVLAKDL